MLGTSLGGATEGMALETPTGYEIVIDTVMLPRCCVAEQHSLQQPKYRVVDDLSMSQVNATAGASDAYCPHGLDTLVAQKRTLPKIGAADFRAMSVDFPNAYKTIGIHET